MKPDVLVVTPMPGGAQAAIEQEFTAHSLWDAKVPAAALAAVAPKIRAVATTGFVGADAKLIDMIQRLMPVNYWKPMQALMKSMRK